MVSGGGREEGGGINWETGMDTDTTVYKTGN